MRAFEYVLAGSIPDAARALELAGAVVKGGGIDLVDRLKSRTIAPPRLVGVDRVAGLSGIALDGVGALVIGATTKLAALAEHPEVVRRLPALAAAARDAATPQVRAMATLAGNLLQRPRCWYFRSPLEACPKRGDAVACPAIPGRHEYGAIFANTRCAAVHPSSLAVPLLALGAELRVTGPAGERAIPFDALFVGPEVDILREHTLAAGEVATAIRVLGRDSGRLVEPGPDTARILGAQLASAYAECRHRQSSDWPLATCAVAGVRAADGSLSEVRVVLGAVAGVPHRALAAERLLEGKRIDPALATRVAEAALDGATPLPLNRYKLAIVSAVVAEAVTALAPL